MAQLCVCVCAVLLLLCVLHKQMLASPGLRERWRNNTNSNNTKSNSISSNDNVITLRVILRVTVLIIHHGMCNGRPRSFITRHARHDRTRARARELRMRGVKVVLDAYAQAAVLFRGQCINIYIYIYGERERERERERDIDIGVCIYIYIYICMRTYTHTHTYIGIVYRSHRSVFACRRRGRAAIVAAAIPLLCYHD